MMGSVHPLKPLWCMRWLSDIYTDTSANDTPALSTVSSWCFTLFSQVLLSGGVYFFHCVVFIHLFLILLFIKNYVENVFEMI